MGRVGRSSGNDGSMLMLEGERWVDADLRGERMVGTVLYIVGMRNWLLAFLNYLGC